MKTELIPHSRQKLSCIGNNDTAQELLTPLLRQLNFWCKSGITYYHSRRFAALNCNS